MKKLDTPTRLALWSTVLTSPVLFVFLHFGEENRGWAAWVFAVVLSYSLGAHWKSRRRVMFWIGAAVLVVLHVDLLVHLPWNTWNLHGHWPKLLALVDFACDVAVMQLVLLPAKLRGRNASASARSDADPASIESSRL